MHNIAIAIDSSNIHPFVKELAMYIFCNKHEYGLVESNSTGSYLL